MLKEMKTRELLNIQTNADTQDRDVLYSDEDIEIVKNDENMSKYEVLDNAPFVVVQGSDGWFIVMGEHIVSEKRFDTKDSAKRYVDSKPWELIIVGASAYNKILEKLESDNNDFNNDKLNNNEQES